MLALVLAAFALQGLAMAVDEGVFHRRRGLPRWERIGHPLDSATVLACYAWLLGSTPSRGSAFVYAGLAGFSSLFVTKDEPIHARRCEPGELRLHALLFVLHPAVLLGAGWIWWNEPLPLRLELLTGGLALTAGFLVFQTVYWNFGGASSMTVNVDNEVYRRLGERWYVANDDPVALLRAEARLHAAWVAASVRAERPGPIRLLDVGCGGGFFAQELLRHDSAFEVVGLDRAPEAVLVAKEHDATGRARFVEGDARSLPFPDEAFDAVCAMDVLEHVEPGPVVAEAARVLRPGGSFYFHTFNRTWLARLVVVHAVELFVRNVPPHLHDYRAFVRPDELAALCQASGLCMRELRGSRPELSTSLLRLGLTGVVPPGLAFRFSPSLKIGYAGRAERMA